MQRTATRAAMSILVCAGLLAWQAPATAAPKAARSYISARYGYTLALPDGWKATQGDCAPAAVLSSADGKGSIRIAVLAGGAAQLQPSLDRGILGAGRVQGLISYGSRKIQGASFQSASASLTLAGGAIAAAEAVGIARAGRVYTFLGLAGGAGPGRAAALAQVRAALGSIQLPKSLQAASPSRVGPPPCPVPATPTATRTATRTTTSTPTRTASATATGVPSNTAIPTSTAVPPTPAPPTATSTAVPTATLPPVATAVPADQAGVKILAFYASTKAGYDTWVGNNYVEPPSVDRFPAGTNALSFFFHFKDAQAYFTKLTLVFYGAGPQVLLTEPPYFAPFAEGEYMEEIYLKDGATFPPGSYHADLVFDGTILGRVFITIAG